MMKHPQVSIIVPVYNVDRYLSECIESILAQSFTDFELILINDGSKDSSGEICDIYAAADSRVIVHHKHNAGVSAARNDGIKLSGGEWILFVDSDDWLNPNFVSCFMNENPDREDSLLLVQSLQSIEEGLVQEVYSFSNKSGLLNEVLLNEDLYQFGSPCCKLYNRDIIIENHLVFSEKISFGEDTLFFLSYLGHVDRIRTFSHQGYYYRKHSSESLSRKAHPIDEQMFYFILHFELLQKLISSKGLNEKLVWHTFSKFYIWGLFVAWVSQYKLDYSSQVIQFNAGKYSEILKMILSNIRSSDLKSSVVLKFLRNITTFSMLSLVETQLRKKYKRSTEG